MSKEEEKFLLEEWLPVKGKTLRGPNVSLYLEAERILEGRDKINKRNCSCQLRGMAENVHNLFSEWQRKQSI